ncbi:hypothetical protein ACMU_07775 [Actibacterium mucosum KCTC 23349]|uniref:BD-FAE-like domain-containing protein n=1 Tax=Actibacterium mucosum KCTC 23349 TaxID=1454373 RepID=A0A037ZL62_9RHOB|nr:hypothetical protein ACMU_07775 [Actibacterium mucosum KCTC 23349]
MSLSLSISGPAFAAGPTHADVAYASGSKQKYDLYMPANPTRNTPVLVVVHGGGWVAGDKSNKNAIAFKAPHYTAKGYVVASVNYRLLPGTKPDEQARDVARAIKHIQASSSRWGGDPTNMAVMGHSSGAHLLALVAGNPEAYELRNWKATVLLDTEALDVANLMRNGAGQVARGAFGIDPSYWTQVSPAETVTAGMAPVFIMCSALRETACPQAREYGEDIEAVGGTAHVRAVQLTHEEVNTSIGQQNGYTGAVDNFLRNSGLR